MSSNTSVSARPLAMRYGLIGGLVSIIIGLVLQLTGVSNPLEQYSAGNIIAGLLSWGIIAAAVYMTIKQHRDEDLNGWISMGKGFGIGMLVILIIAVLQSAWSVIYMEVINPTLMEEIMDNAMEKALEEGKMTEEQMEASQGMMGFFASSWFVAVSSLVATLLMGLIVSLLMALFLKKEPKTDF